MNKEIKLDKLTLEELKVLAFDNLRQLEILQSNQKIIIQEIIKKESNGNEKEEINNKPD